MKSLLVIKPSSLGDIVHALQVVQTLARERPECRISWVVRDRFAGLVQAAPFVHETIIFQRHAGLGAFISLLRTLHARQFDAVWDMQGLLRSGLMTVAAQAPEKWGRNDAREGAGWFCNRRISPPVGPGPHHILDILQPFLTTAGVPPGLHFPLELKPSRVFGWEDFFTKDSHNTFVIFTDSRGGREWPHYSELTALIFSQIPGGRIVWCAGRRIEPARPADPKRFLNMTGCPLDEMIALVRQPAIFIGNDSGPMHLAAASGNPVLAIFGPTSPCRSGPYPLDVAKHCAVRAPDGRLDRLDPAAVLAALQELRSRVL